ncbi:MAG: CHAT domain-containing protein [Bacteroidetes bacterium]|nr:CHAT domain-containing protein [Bacteroidota bacterium]
MKKNLLLILIPVFITGMLVSLFYPSKEKRKAIYTDLSVKALDELDSIAAFYQRPLTISEEDAEWLYKKAMVEIFEVDGNFTYIGVTQKGQNIRAVKAIKALELSAIMYNVLGRHECELQSYRMLLYADYSFQQPDSIFSQYIEKINFLQDSVVGKPEPLTDLNFTNEERIKLGQEMRNGSFLVNYFWATEDDIYTEREGKNTIGKAVWLAEDFMISSMIYFNSHEFDKGFQCLKAAEDLYRMLGNPLKINSLYMVLTEYLNLAGKNEESLMYQEKMLETSHFHPDYNTLYIWSLTKLGDTYQRNGQIEKALEYYKKADEKIRNLSPTAIVPEMVGSAESLLALNYLKLGMLHKADAFFQNSMKRLESIKDSMPPERVADIMKAYTPAYGNLTQYAFIKNQYETAITYADITQKSLSMLQDKVFTQRIGGIEGVLAKAIMKKAYKITNALNYTNFAAVYGQLHEYEAALNYYQKAETSFSGTTNSKFFGDMLLNRAEIFIHINQFENAFQDIQKAEKLAIEYKYPGSLPMIYHSYSSLFSHKQDFAQALFYAKKMTKSAIETENHFLQQKGYVEQAKALYELQQINQALSLLKDSIVVQKLFEEKNSLLQVRMLEGKIMMKQQRFQEALNIFLKGIEFIEREFLSLNGELSQQVVIQNTIEFFDGAVEAAIKLGNTEEAFEIYERSKNISLNGLLSRKSAILNADIDAETIQEIEERELKIRINNSKLYTKNLDSSRVEEIRLENNKLQKEVDAIYFKIIKSSGKDTREEQNATSIEDIQKKLTDNQVLIEYMLTEKEAHVFAIDQKSIHRVALGPTSAIQSSIDDFHKNFLQINGPNSKATNRIPRFQRVSNNLYQLLISPIADTLALAGKELLIVPDGSLYKLPFELLVSNEEIPSRWHEFHYLIQDYPISYYPSATTFLYLKNHHWEKRKTAMDILLAAPKYHPKFGQMLQLRTSEGYEQRKQFRKQSAYDLPFARKEVKEISRVFSPDKVTIWLNEEANEKQIKDWNEAHRLRQYQIIHFAAHARIDESYPQLSAILFPPDPDSIEDGYLQPFEIRDLDLNAEMVVLSSCESGLGKIIRGEGMIGYMRSLMYAGTQSVMLSLWAVQDSSTSELMQSYYRALTEEDMKNKYLPLRKAQLEMINRKDEFSNPYYWAPFVFMGNRISL